MKVPETRTVNKTSSDFVHSKNAKKGLEHLNSVTRFKRASRSLKQEWPVKFRSGRTEPSTKRTCGVSGKYHSKRLFFAAETTHERKNHS